jgi:hypothetical protein
MLQDFKKLGLAEIELIEKMSLRVIEVSVIKSPLALQIGPVPERSGDGPLYLWTDDRWYSSLEQTISVTPALGRLSSR